MLMELAEKNDPLASVFCIFKIVFGGEGNI